MNSQQWFDRAEREGTPFIEGDQVTFVYFGVTAPTLMGDFQAWGLGDQAFPTMTEQTHGVWTTTITLPRDAYIEYAFTTDPEDSDARLLDPFNRRPVSTGFRQFNASLTMPDFKPSVLKGRKAPKGKVGKFRVEHPLMLLGKKRDVWLYQPPVSEPVPLLVVYDGRDYVYKAHLPQLLDHLIAKKKMRPVALACLQHAEESRIPEYFMGEAVLAVIMRELLPMARKFLNLVDVNASPGAYGVMGASIGGLMALYTAMRVPHIFGQVISQSGSYHLDLDEQTPLLLKKLWAPRQPVRIWQDVGRYEWLLATNRQLNAELNALGYDVTYREYNTAHNWTSWHHILPDALASAFAPASAYTSTESGI